MASPVAFPESNDVLRAAPGTESYVSNLPIYRQGLSFADNVRYDPCVISAWKLTPEELAEVARTGILYFRAEGTTHPPISVYGINPFTPQPTEQA